MSRPVRVAGLDASHQRAFTLVELVAVVVLIAIVAAVIGPSFFNNDAFGQRGYADELAGALRYAQRVAVASDCPVRLEITSAGYAAFQQAAAGGTCNPAGAWNVAIRRADGGNIAGAPPAGVDFLQNVAIEFGADGSVTNGAPPALGVGPFTLSVVAATGAVTITP